MQRSAVISPCGLFRYELRRVWQPEKPLVAIIGLNPSTADAQADDPTLRRAINFAMHWGCGGLVMLNLFALRSRHPKALRGALDPIGPENDAVLIQATASASRVVVAWGSQPWKPVEARARAVVELLRPRALEAIERTQSGHPRHPLFLPCNLHPEPWVAPWEAREVLTEVTR